MSVRAYLNLSEDSVETSVIEVVLSELKNTSGFARTDSKNLKKLTCAGILFLVEQGKLELADFDLHILRRYLRLEETYINNELNGPKPKTSSNGSTQDKSTSSSGKKLADDIFNVDILKTDNSRSELDLENDQGEDEDEEDRWFKNLSNDLPDVQG